MLVMTHNLQVDDIRIEQTLNNNMSSYESKRVRHLDVCPLQHKVVRSTPPQYVQCHRYTVQQ